MSKQLKNIIEALLMATSVPLNLERIWSLLQSLDEPPERAVIQEVLVILQQEYQERGIMLIEVASGFRFQTKAEYSQWINRLFETRVPHYSRAIREVLAIIIYSQPITRGEIEAIRGVSLSPAMIRALQEREWIKVVGHKDTPGKPELFATTKNLLDYFNMKQLSDFPPLPDLPFKLPGRKSLDLVVVE